MWHTAADLASRVAIHIAEVVGAVALGDEVALLALVRLHLCRASAEVGVADLCGIWNGLNLVPFLDFSGTQLPTRDVNSAVLDVGFAGGLDAAAQSARVTTERPDVIVVSGSLEFLAAANHFWIAQLYE